MPFTRRPGGRAAGTMAHRFRAHTITRTYYAAFVHDPDGINVEEAFAIARVGHAHLHHRLRRDDSRRVPGGTSRGWGCARDRRPGRAAPSALGFSKTPLVRRPGRSGHRLRPSECPGDLAVMVARPRAQGGTKSWNASTPASWNCPKPWPRARKMIELGSREKPQAVLCYERDLSGCHRTLLLESVAPDAEVSTCSPELGRQLELHRDACPNGQPARRTGASRCLSRGRRAAALAGSVDDNRRRWTINRPLAGWRGPGDGACPRPGIELWRVRG